MFSISKKSQNSVFLLRVIQKNLSVYSNESTSTEGCCRMNPLTSIFYGEIKLRRSSCYCHSHLLRDEIKVTAFSSYLYNGHTTRKRLIQLIFQGHLDKSFRAVGKSYGVADFTTMKSNGEVHN